MALAVRAVPQVPGSHSQIKHDRRRQSRRDQGRFISRAVRERNELAEHPWWQPSRSHKQFKRSRRTEIEAAIADEVDELIEAPERLVVGYSRNRERWEKLRRKVDRREIEERHRVILAEIEADFQRIARQHDIPTEREVLTARVASLEAELTRVSALTGEEGLLPIAAVIEMQDLEQRLEEVELELYDIEVAAIYAA